MVDLKKKKKKKIITVNETKPWDLNSTLFSFYLTYIAGVVVFADCHINMDGAGWSRGKLLMTKGNQKI